MREMAGRAGHRPRARAPATAAAHEDYLAAPGRARRRAADRRHHRRRHARPGQVPARRWSRTRWPPGPGVNPLGDEARSPSWGSGGPPGPACAAGRAGGRPHDPGRGDRLRHQLDPAAGRRRRPADRRATPTCCAGWRSSGSARASTAPAGSPPRRSSAPGACSPSTPRSARELGAERGAVRRDQRHPRRRQPRRVRRRCRATPRRRQPEVVTGDEEAELSFVGATARWTLRGAHGAAAGRRSWSSTSAAARPSSCSATPTACEAARSVDIGCVRLTERHLHGDPPTADEIAGRRGRHRRRARRGRRRRCRSREARDPGRAGRLGHHGRRARAGAAGLRRRTRIHDSRIPVDRRPRGHRRTCSR